MLAKTKCAKMCGGFYFPLVGNVQYKKRGAGDKHFRFGLAQTPYVFSTLLPTVFLFNNILSFQILEISIRYFQGKNHSLLVEFPIF